MHKNNSLILAFLLATGVTSFAAAADKPAKSDKLEFNFDCPADREFITTYEYLKHKKEFGLKPNEMRPIAMAVTKGCTGAASSFIEATELLLKTGIDARTAIEQARDLSARGDRYAKSFIAIFRGAFAKEFLDMDSGTSLKIARKLTTEFKGDPSVASEDYFTLAKFCVETKGLDLPRPECASMAGRVAGFSEESKLPVAKAFINILGYLTNSKEVNLSLRDALPLAESLVAVSPVAAENFKNAYEYASEKNGLELSRADAINFAKSVSINAKQPKSM